MNNYIIILHLDYRQTHQETIFGSYGRALDHAEELAEDYEAIDFNVEVEDD